MLSFVAPVRRLDTSPGDAYFTPRWDLAPGSNGLSEQINIQDILAVLAGATGNPPMFGGAPAFGKTCPFPP
jgi:hypothetical protein